jgi:hypothetical protein
MLCDQLISIVSPNVSFMSWQYWCKFIWILVGICSAYQFGTCFAPSHCTYNRGMLIRNFSGLRCICMLRWLQRWGCSNDYFREAWIMPVLFPVKHVMSNLFRKLLFNYFSWNVKRDLKTNFPWNVHDYKISFGRDHFIEVVYREKRNTNEPLILYQLHLTEMRKLYNFYAVNDTR